MPHVRPILTADEFRTAFNVSCETVDKLECYRALLTQWQKAVNLVAPATLDHVWHRHFADSAQLAILVPDTATRLVDLGSGAGFPGLVLAIMLEDQARAGTRSGQPAITLVESDQRKCAFLREVARQLMLPVNILPARIENPGTHYKVAPVDIVTARALAPLVTLLEWSLPVAGPGALGLFLKGRTAADEVAAARPRFPHRFELLPSVTEPDARIVVVHQLGSAEGGAA